GSNAATGVTATMTVSTAGIGSFTTGALANNGTTTITITNLKSGSNGSTCSTDITVNRTATILVGLPTITSTTPASRSNPGSVTLGATASTGTINWYAAATGGVPLHTGSSYTTPSISTTTTYYVSATLDNCNSTPRTAVVATVYQPEIDVRGNSISIVGNNTKIGRA